MNFASLKPTAPRLQRSAVALALAAFGVGASALPVFTVDGDGSGTAASPVQADNILISDFARVLTPNPLSPLNPLSFAESGYLSVTDLQLGGVTVQNSGLGTAYNMYVEFSGSGTSSSAANPNSAPTFGTFQELTYSLYRYSGPVATFGVGPGGATINGVTPGPAVGVLGEVLIATGSLISGNVSTTPGFAPVGKFSPSASTLLTFDLTTAGRGVFTAPSPFYNLAFAAFTNNPSQVTMFDGGFTIAQGGGSINFQAMAPIPEPETYALMLAGLAAVGFVARRRRPQA